MMPVIAKLKDAFEGRIPVYQIDIDKQPKETQAENVTSYPTYILYENGMEVWRHEGETSLEYLLAELEYPR
jgi:thioredoxin-like negative regulator of GroEL